MNKVELITSVVEKTGLTRKDTEKTLAAILETVVETVASSEKVQLVGFGTFEPRDRKERKGHNPRTKEPITIPATTLPVFKAGKGFRDSVAKK